MLTRIDILRIYCSNTIYNQVYLCHIPANIYVNGCAFAEQSVSRNACKLAFFFLDISLSKGAPSHFITLPTPPGSCVPHDIFNIIQEHKKFIHGFFLDFFFTNQNYLQILQWSMFIYLSYLTPDFNFQTICFNRHNKTEHTLVIMPCMWHKLVQ